MERETNPSTTSLCRAGCGFYGSSATDNFCSKCFKDNLKRKQDPARLSPTATVNTSPSLMATTTDHTPLASTSALSPNQSCGSSTGGEVASACAASCLAAKSVLPTPNNSQQAQQLEPPLTAVSSTSSFESTQSTNTSGSDVATATSGGEPMQGDATAASVVAAQPNTKKKNRCMECNKKVGLTGFNCRCGGLFCSEHRYSDSHSCSFDYKAMGAAEIRKNNPVVVSDKIEKL